MYAIVAPRQIDRGGNVILVQIENEYGAYGSDKEYLAELVRLTRELGVTVPLTTVDQPQPQMLRDGSLPGLHMTGSFGARATERLATLREHQPTGPLMCSEFWDGWFDWWGGVHHTTDVASAAQELDTLLAAGASINIYMVHGGTNFALTNGANDKGRYLPIVTSYDYDAPIDEAGHPTEKFFAFRDVIAKYAPVPDELPPVAEPAPTPSAPLAVASEWLGEVAPGASSSDVPPTFEALGHLGALVRYDAALDAGAFGDAATALLEFEEVRDLAWVFVDDAPVGRLSRGLHERTLAVPRGSALTVLVEEQGRVNYAHRLGEEKGLIGAVTLGGSPLGGWTATPIDLDELARRTVSSGDRRRRRWQGPVAGPVSLRGTFALDETVGSLPRYGCLGQGLRVRERILPRPVLAERPAAVAVRAGARDARGRERRRRDRARGSPRPDGPVRGGAAARRPGGIAGGARLAADPARRTHPRSTLDVVTDSAARSQTLPAEMETSMAFSAELELSRSLRTLPADSLTLTS